MFLAACGVKENAIELKNKYFGSDSGSDSTETAVDPSESELTGMLLVINPDDCPLASGCGPQFSLLGRNLTTQVAIQGDIDPAHDKLILSIVGDPSSLPDDLKTKSGYENVSAQVNVEKYRLRSSIPYHPFLADEAENYASDSFGCDLLWDKSFSWSIANDVPLLNVKMTNTLSPEPQPWIELTYNGNNGQLIDSAVQPPDVNPCDS